jgi:hypothetical protein
MGRPHLMIDGTVRKQRILAAAWDPQMAILFLDFVLGYNTCILFLLIKAICKIGWKSLFMNSCKNRLL